MGYEQGSSNLIRLVSSQPDTQKIPQTTFSEDTVDWFRKQRSGHMAKWLFSSPKFDGDKACGATVWEKVIAQAKTNSDYYVFQDELSIINAALPKLKNHFKSPLTLVDLGPGSKDAIESKTCPIISELHSLVRQYISIDTNQDFLKSAHQIISGYYPQVANGSLCLDFIEDSFRFPAKENTTVGLVFGITLCNMLIDPREKDLSIFLLASSFRRLRSHFSTAEGYLIITQDTNQDERKLKAAYTAISEYFYPLLHRIRRDLAVFGNYDPKNFSLDLQFIKETKAFSVSFVADKKMTFTVDGNLINLKAGDRLYMGNSFKFDKTQFLEVANSAGFSHIETIEQPNNPCILHIMKTK